MGESYSQAATQTLDDEDVEDAELSVCSSQEDLPEYWGRLYPAKPTVKFRDLTQNLTTVGKTKSCDICLQVEEISEPVWAVMSRFQFNIVRIHLESFGSLSYKVQVKDLSMNGTYVNGELVGKGNLVTLIDNSVIAVGRPLYEVFYYKDSWVISRAPSNLKNRYDVGVRLGTGAFGEVHMVFDKRTGRSLAMKTIIKGCKTNQKKIESELQKLENEMTILRKIKHPNVIQLVDDIDCDNEKFLFLELMGGKDLFQRIINGHRLSEQISKLYFYQMALGVEYLHRHGITHRDLKPENILLASYEDETLLKITDFGLSKIVHSATYLMSLCGTKLYAAPEVLESRGYKKYTSQVDVWSMGAVLYVCLSGSTPFVKDKHGKTMEDQIKAGDYTMSSREWEGVSEGAKLIIKKMMTVNPLTRITISEVLEDSWLKDPSMRSKVKALTDIKLASEENIPDSVAEDVESPRSPCPPQASEMLSEKKSLQESTSEEGYGQVEDREAPRSPSLPEVENVQVENVEAPLGPSPLKVELVSPQRKRMKCT